MIRWQPNSAHAAMVPQSNPPIRKPSALGLVRSLPFEQREKMVCVTMQMRRSSLLEPWRISLSMFGDRIVIGKTEQGGASILQWCHAIPCKNFVVPPELLFVPLSLMGGSSLVYAHHVKQQLSKILIHAPIHHQLLPGDLVIGVDGLESKAFTDLSQITTYLRHLTHFTLVVLRHSDATSAALGEWDVNRRLNQPELNYPFRAASAADNHWKNVFSTPITLSGVRTPFHATSVRQVTPEAIATPNAQALMGSSDRSITQLNSNGFYVKRPMIPPPSATKKETKPKRPMPLPEPWRNPWFKGPDGKGLPFVDNWEFSPEDGTRSELFLPPIDDFPTWLTQKKKIWKSRYKVYKLAPADSDEEFEGEKMIVSHDFWTHQGFSSFQEWRSKSAAKWNLSYSWNKRKRQRIQKEREEIVHVSQDPDQFVHWLKIRRNQWRVLRRKRQRELAERASGKVGATGVEEMDQHQTAHAPVRPCDIDEDPTASKRRRVQVAAVQDMAAIDLILEQEEQERKRRLQARASFDLSFIFYASTGAPDDIVVHILGFLGRKEHAKLVGINASMANALKQRDQVWRQLCPKHWVLPRRPRKPWHELYFHKLRIELFESQKRWDDLLIKCSVVLGKGDQVQKIEKLVRQGEAEFGFHVNYVSPVVCERNSLLNLAIINQRHKVARWLLDHRKPDIESVDRGHFSPLLNAAWAGDRQLVRLMMQRGADRTKIGFGHYSKALAHPDFKGLTPEGWARKRGFDDIAELIRLGL